MAEAGIAGMYEMFNGIPSHKEIGRVADAWRDQKIDAVFAIGGGSCNDCGKGVAFQLKVRLCSSRESVCTPETFFSVPEEVCSVCCVLWSL